MTDGGGGGGGEATPKMPFTSTYLLTVLFVDKLFFEKINTRWLTKLISNIDTKWLSQAGNNAGKHSCSIILA